MTGGRCSSFLGLRFRSEGCGGRDPTFHPRWSGTQHRAKTPQTNPSAQGHQLLSLAGGGGAWASNLRDNVFGFKVRKLESRAFKPDMDPLNNRDMSVGAGRGTALFGQWTPLPDANRDRFQPAAPTTAAAPCAGSMVVKSRDG